MANSGGVYIWDRTASNNATADSTVNWSEGQAPSSINDSARAMMTSVAKWRDDISGAITTGGSSTAYTVSSYEVFDTLAHMNGQMIAFTPHTTNGATVTLNVDSLGAKPLRSAPSTELAAGVLIQGTPYIAIYNNSDAAFYLQSLFGNPYNIPIAGGIDYWGTTAPNSSFVFPFGQAISRTTYSVLFALVGTTFGTGDGSTTFNIPDKRGRVSAAIDNMGGSDASRLSNGNCSLVAVRGTLGGGGGEGAHALTLGEAPTGITSSGSNSISVNSGVRAVWSDTSGGSVAAGGASQQVNNISQLVSTGTNTINVTSNNTGGTTHNNCQPTIMCNYIMRII